MEWSGTTLACSDRWASIVRLHFSVWGGKRQTIIIIMMKNASLSNLAKCVRFTVSPIQRGCGRSQEGCSHLTAGDGGLHVCSAESIVTEGRKEESRSAPGFSLQTSCSDLTDLRTTTDHRLSGSVKTLRGATWGNTEAESHWAEADRTNVHRNNDFTW